jgi:hypothetical protein
MPDHFWSGILCVLSIFYALWRYIFQCYFKYTNYSMGYKSENLEKLKRLTDEMSTKEQMEVEEKKCIIYTLEKIRGLLDNPRINKKAVKEEISSLMVKLSS